MDERAFWLLIDDSRDGRDGFKAQVRRLGRRLKGLPPAEVVDFGEHWLAAHARAYRWPV